MTEIFAHQKGMEQNKQKYFDEVEYLSQTAMELMNLPFEENLFHYIGSKVSEIISDAIIGVSSYDQKTDTIHLRELFGLGNLTESVITMLGIDPFSTPMRVTDDAKRGLSQASLVKIEGGLFEILLETVPKSVCRTAEILYDLKAIYGQGLVWDETLHGAVIIMLKKRERLANEKTVEFLIRLGASALQKRKIEQALRESEERYRQLFENSPLGIYRSTPEGRILEANPAFIEMLGFTSLDELRKRNPKDFPTNYPWEKFREIIEKSGALTGFETEWTSKENKTIYTRENVKAVRGSGGQILSYEGTLENITEKKIIEQDLRESEAQYRTLFEISPDAVVLFDVFMNLVKINSAGAALFGYNDVDEGIGQNFFELIASQDQSRLKEDLRALLIQGRTIHTEYEMRRKDGACFPAEVKAGLDMDAEGAPAQVIVATRDISIRKHAEKKLKDSMLLYRNLIETSPDAIVVADIDFNIIIVNSQLLSLLGLSSQEDVLSKNCIEFIFSEQRDAAVILSRSLQETDFIHGIELEVLTKNGDRIPVEINASALRDSEKELYAYHCIIRDITERKKTEQEILEAKERAERSDKFKDIFIAKMSHEFRNPLSLILGHTRILEDELEDVRREEIGENLDAIERAGERLQLMIQDLLNFASFQAGTFHVKREIIDLSGLIDTVVADMKIIAERQKLSLENRVFCDTPTIYGDRYVITQALMNLIDNAIKYTHNGGITVDLFKENGRICVSVSDTGVGIEPEYLPNIFSEFSQERVGQTRPIHGLGLGLALTKSYVEACGGTISVKSRKGEGTTFTMIFEPAQI